MKLKLVNIKDETPDTKTFYFEPNEEIKYTAGQYLYFTIPNLKYEDARGNTRHFTLSSSPTEKLIAFTTKFPPDASGFKKTLLELPVGGVIESRGPQGTFFIDYSLLPIRCNLFIAGGIGITPFRSIIKYAHDTNQNIPMYLIYSNSDENFAFKDELTSLLGDKVVFVNSKISGHLDNLKIKELIENCPPAQAGSLKIDNLTPWVVGPPKFVDAIEEALEKLGVSSGKILTEKFTGY